MSTTSKVILVVFLLGVAVLGYFFIFGNKAAKPVIAPAVMNNTVIGNALASLGIGGFAASNPGLTSGVPKISGFGLGKVISG